MSIEVESSSLTQLQREFQRYLLCDDPAVAARVHASGQNSAAARLGVYADAYRIRLVDAIESNYPHLRQLLGGDRYAQIAIRYVAQHASRTASIRWYGDALEQMLASIEPAQPWLAELARWEWSLAIAFDAADVATLPIATLAGLGPDEWIELELHFHPSVQLLALHTNAPAIYQALAAGDGDVPAGRTLAAPQAWLIWRKELAPHFRSISAAEYVALSVMRRGATFEQMCDRLCDQIEPEEVPLQAAAMLRTWATDGLLAESLS